MKKKRVFVLFLAFSLLLSWATLRVRAQTSYTQIQQILAAAGQVYTSTNFSLSGTFGEPVTSDNTASGSASYILSSGFWGQTNNPPSFYTVAGQISDSGGTPVSGVTISNSAGYTTTNGNGDYTLSGLLTGSYAISPSKKLARVYSYLFTPVSRVVTVPPNVSGQNFTLNYATLSGWVTNADTGAGIGGVQIVLNFTSAIKPTSLVTNTDSNGNYQFTNLPIFKPVSIGGIQVQGFRVRVTKNGYTDYESGVAISSLNNTKNIVLEPMPTTCLPPLFRQRDPQWKKTKLHGCLDNAGHEMYTIGSAGCALTSVAMIFSYYGANGGNLTPPILNDRLGTLACPMRWNDAQYKSDKKASQYQRRPFDWKILESELKKHPVILGMCKNGTCGKVDSKGRSLEQQHWVVIVSGQGDKRQNYRMNDPWYAKKDMKLSDSYSKYTLKYLITYNGQAVCGAEAATKLDTGSITQTPNLLGIVSPNQEANLNLSEQNIQTSSVISGSAEVYQITDEITLTVELEAQSSVGEVTEMLVWSDSLSNTTWLPFSNFVELPASDFVYVQFRDEFGNITEVYSDTINPVGPPDVLEENFLPLIIKEQ